jgi:diguanylate cyclase (GGDEF)-like protein
VIVLDVQGALVQANRSALDLLCAGPAGDCGLQDLLGRILARIGVAPEGVPASNGPGRGQFEIAPGRVLDCIRQPVAGGGSVLTLLDVSPFLDAVQSAHRDPLTGLANRAALRDRLVELLSGPDGAGRRLSVLCVDLDRFKTVNDTLGHPMGDALLRKVADRLRGAVRHGDFVARMGGDEFTVLQIDPPGASAEELLAHRLVDLIGRAYAIDGHVLNIGASIGIARVPADGTGPDDLLKKADLALYAAKAGGRNTFRVFQTDMEAQLNARRALEFDLRKAMAMRELRLLYQPQIELSTGRTCGFEALLRWQHPRRGTVSPAEFIPLAEEIGLIVPIGEWVLRMACRQAASWPDHVGIGVNLSAVQFRSPRLFESIASALEQARLDPVRLELEITESALIHDTETVLGVLNRVRSMGVRVSMDDFGTGYSSLSYLQRFPFDKIKIDQSFVRGPDADGDKQAIVRAITGLGASLGMRTTAEGVETPEQLKRMRQEGCTEVQGYLTGRPLTPEDAATRLATEHFQNTPTEPT